MRTVIRWAAVVVIGVVVFWSLVRGAQVLGNQRTLPDAVLLLDGDEARFVEATNLAKSDPRVPIVFSTSASGFTIFRDVVRNAGLSLDRFVVYYCPTDTVTNFTCVVDDLVAANYKHVLVMTSNYHMIRALSIGRIVLGSKGIAVSSFTVAGDEHLFRESKMRAVRDILRSLIWVATGWSGSEFRK